MWELAEEVMLWKGDVGGLEKQLLRNHRSAGAGRQIEPCGEVQETKPSR